MNDCPPEEILAGIVAGVLSLDENLHWKRHLDHCPQCREWVEEAQAAEKDFTRLIDDADEASRSSEELTSIRDAIDEFQVLELIGRGGMGSIYFAEQRAPRRKVALKTPNFDRFEPRLVDRFLEETEKLAALQHPCIAQMYSVHRFRLDAQEHPYYAMEFVDGLRLNEYANHHHLDHRGRVELLIGVADALAYAHKRGVIHLDLKPANILVNSEGTPKVLDFGIARWKDEIHTKAHNSRACGTPHYMSPEQGRGEVPDLRSDIYSLGRVGHELLLQDASIGNLDLTITDAEMSRDDLAPLGQWHKKLRGDLEAVFACAQAKDKDDRYQSMDAFAHDLRCYLGRRPVRVRSKSSLYVAQRWCRRHWLPVTLTLAVLIAAVTGFESVRSRAQAEREQQLVRLLALGDERFNYIYSDDRGQFRRVLEKTFADMPDHPVVLNMLGRLALFESHDPSSPARDQARQSALTYFRAASEQGDPWSKVSMAEIERSLGAPTEQWTKHLDFEPHDDPFIHQMIRYWRLMADLEAPPLSRRWISDLRIVLDDSELPPMSIRYLSMLMSQSNSYVSRRTEGWEGWKMAEQGREMVIKFIGKNKARLDRGIRRLYNDEIGPYLEPILYWSQSSFTELFARTGRLNPRSESYAAYLKRAVEFWPKHGRSWESDYTFASLSRQRALQSIPDHETRGVIDSLVLAYEQIDDPLRTLGPLYELVNLQRIEDQTNTSCGVPNPCQACRHALLCTRMTQRYDARVRLARNCLAAGFPGYALHWIQEALALVTRCSEEREREVRAQIIQAEALFGVSRSDEGTMIYDDVLAERAGDAIHFEALVSLARSSTRSGDFAGALDAIRRAESIAGECRTFDIASLQREEVRLYSILGALDSADIFRDASFPASY